MKTSYQKIKIKTSVCLMLLISGAMGMTNCEDKMGEHFYTFKGEMMSDYLTNRPEQFSIFTDVLRRTQALDRLSLYGEYTCFAPTNKAMENYFSEKGITTVAELSDAECDTIAYNHLLDKACYTIDITDDVLFNMNEKPIAITVDTINGQIQEVYYVENSQIILRDDSVENGVVHTIDKLLVPSSKLLPDMMVEDPAISLFCEALLKTELDKLIRSYRDEAYESQYTEKRFGYSTGYETEDAKMPPHRYLGNTAFVEPNSVYDSLGIHTLDDLIHYACGIYTNGVDDQHYTQPTNGLYQYVAYHLLNRTAYFTTLTYTGMVVPGYEAVDYFETRCPNTLLKVSNDMRTGTYLNRDKTKKIGGIGITSPSESHRLTTAINGVYHYIDAPLIYSTTIRDSVLNTRIRLDAASLVPELMSNGCRGGDDNYYFTTDYFDGMKCSNETKVVMRYRHTDFDCYQGDEMVFLGQYDFSVRIPPVPEGTYEIRLGYTALNNSTRGVIQAYVDNSPCGIPLDLRIYGTNPKIGWVADSETDDNGYQTDKDMRNRRYMKGPDAIRKYYNSRYWIFREQSQTIRRIITTLFMDNRPHTLRFRSVLENPNAAFAFDYIEICPKSVYDNPAGEDRH